jgi:hypothetical protein
MSTSDGSIASVTKVEDNGPPEQRWNLVITSDGYQSTELDQFHTDVSTFCKAFFSTKPFDALKSAINVFRIDVSSTESGADDPTSCGGQNVGRGDVKKTYFDSTFCSDGKIRRLLSCNTATARSVADDKAPHYDQILVIVNSSTYGGSGGSVGTTSTGDTNWPTIAIHEMGHSAFGLADEYESYAGCDSGETDHNTHDATEPAQPNVTVNKDAATIKWKDLVTAGATIPTSTNADCTKCDPTTTSPASSGTVGAFEGAHYFHCGAYRPEWDCIMRTRTPPFCAVCRDVISKKLMPYLPASSSSSSDGSLSSSSDGSSSPSGEGSPSSSDSSPSPSDSDSSSSSDSSPSPSDSDSSSSSDSSPSSDDSSSSDESSSSPSGDDGASSDGDGSASSSGGVDSSSS